MKKRIGRRLVSLLLTVVTILTMLPAMTLPALAAESGPVGGLTDEDIGLSCSGKRQFAWEASDKRITGSANGEKVKALLLYVDVESTTDLTITNTKNNEAKLSFDYVVEANGGTVKLGSKKLTGNKHEEVTVGAKKSVTVSIASGRGEGKYAKITMTNVKLIYDTEATVTFLPAEHGSYTVNNTTITEEQPHTQRSTIAYEVDVTPESGYQFMDWYDVSNKKSISRVPKTELNIEKNCTITARFMTRGSALFAINSRNFDDLNEAVAEAQKNPPATITLVSSGKIRGNYTIPSNVTLLIPFDNTRTDYTTMPGTTGLVAAQKNQRVYTTLTMDEGSQITVYGNISLPAKVSSANAGYTGVISGPCGTIHMKPSSSIVLKNGSNLYCWGFITGTGDIKAEPGATVYEEFQICDYRGGSATSTLNGDKNVFPFAQYYVQNIEATLEIEYGAKETAVCRLHSTSYTKADVSLNFITKDSGGLFNLQPGSSFVKKYDSATERVTYEVIGDANLSSITIDAGDKVNSANFNLPIMQNTTINVKSGTTTLNQSLCLIPGSQVIIDEGAAVKIASGKSLFVYDRSDWVYKEWDKETIDVNGQKKPRYVYSGFTYPGSTDFKPEYYTPSRSSDSWKSHFTTADMKDVKFDVNGTLNVEGKLYTTDGGADITSSLGSGKVVLSTAPTDNVTTHQYMQSRMEYNSSSGKYDKDVSGYKNINATPAKLLNADGKYIETKGANTGDTFTYCKCQDCGDGKWVKEVAAINDSTGKQQTTHKTLQDAVENLKAGQYIKLLHNTTEDINISTRDIYLDLNGRTVTGDITVKSDYKLYGMDSSTGKDYVTAPSGKIVGTVTGTVAPVFEKPLTDDHEYNYLRYVAIKNEASTEYTFHRFNISVTGYRFELATSGTPQCALFFIGKFQGDEEAKTHLKSLGFTLKDENGQLGTDSYPIPANPKEIPIMHAEGEEIDSKVVRAKDGAYLFEFYLMRSFGKDAPATAYTKEFSAIAQATFDNSGTPQDSKPQQLSFLKAWQNPGEITDDKQKEILEDFLKKLGINQ